MMTNSDENSCTVRGTLAVVLKLSMMHGVAPLHLKPLGDAYIVRVSKRRVYSWLLLILIIGTISVGLIMDLSLFGTPIAIRVNTTSGLVVWLCDIGILLSIIIIGFCYGETRMRRTLWLLKEMEKIKEDIGYNDIDPNENSLTIPVILFLIYIYVVVIFDYGIYLLNSYVDRKKMTIVYIYGLVYFGYIMALMVLMQLVFVVLALKSTFKVINDGLRTLINGNEHKDTDKKILLNNSLMFKNKINSVNITKKLILEDISIKDQSIRNLIRSYNILCRLVESFVGDNDLLILILLGSYVGYTFVSYYYMIRDLCIPDLKYKWRNVTSILIPVVWSVFRFVQLYMLIEAFHRTHKEMEKSQVFFSKVGYCTTPAGFTVSPELEMFYNQLLLYKPTFSPKYLYTLNRSQLAAIVAGMTTYMIMIVQYHVIEECTA